ncbi:MAG: RIP metalloprotease RseP, partial [Candidatus Latescibacteria bacterium]|nr:RIP metalloprotease RseP [Candidatus Latescibacterota bacterium]
MIEWITSSAFSLMSFIGLLSVLVIVHEFGHFAVAKKVGIRVEEFAIFFGKVLWSKQIGETLYSIRLIPFGGFVRMTGQNDFGPVEDGDDGPDAEYSFSAKPIWARAAVVAAGPVMNLILAVLVFAVLDIAYGVVGRIGIIASPNIIAESVEPGSAADHAGVSPGGQLVAINGRSVTSLADLAAALSDSASTSLDVEFRHRDERVAVLSLTHYSRVESVGVTWRVPSMVGGVLPIKPGQASGLEAGDLITSVNGQPIGDWKSLREEIARNPGREVPLVYERDGQAHHTLVVPDIDSAVRSDMGVRQGPIDALLLGFQQTYGVMGEMFEFLSRLIGRTISTKYLAGPLGIAQMAGRAAESGIGVFLTLVAMLSTQLGVLNLLPLAVLDGGHLLMFGVESLTGKRPSAKNQGIIQNVGA